MFFEYEQHLQIFHNLGILQLAIIPKKKNGKQNERAN